LFLLFLSFLLLLFFLSGVLLSHFQSDQEPPGPRSSGDQDLEPLHARGLDGILAEFIMKGFHQLFGPAAGRTDDAVENRRVSGLLGMDGIDQVLAEGVAGLTSTEFAKLNIAIAKTVQYWRLPPDSVPPPPDLSDLWQPIETAPVAEWVLVRSQSRCWVAVQPRDGVGWYDVDTRSQEPIEWRPLPPGGMRMGDGEGEV
jgi:hypothetical protein